MRLIVIIFSMLFMGISVSSLGTNGDKQLELSSECIEQGKIRDEDFNSEIMADIIDSFQLDIDSSYHKLTLRDIEVSHILYGARTDDTYYKSLAKLFGTIKANTRGTPRLFVRPNNAYFLYKETSNVNVMIHLILESEQWQVVEEKRVAGNEIAYEQLKCEEPLLKTKK